MRRLLGIFFGVLTQALFIATVGMLFWFLEGDMHHAHGSVWIDLLLATHFSVVHSLFLLPAVRERLERWIPKAFYGLCFCLSACSSLLLVILLWRTSDVVIWQATGIAAPAIRTVFVAGWFLLVYSLHLSGFGYQTGWTPWWYWFRRRPVPSRTFRPRGAYRIMRHPIYFCFLILIWAAPTITLDRAMLIAVWTVYILVGSYLKDQRLKNYLGVRYRAYQAQVPGYPGLVSGPLGRVSWDRNGARNERKRGGLLAARVDTQRPAVLRRQSSVQRAALSRAIIKGLRRQSLSSVSTVTRTSAGSGSETDHQI
jgi:protein-S-isoprenylcysteine O-methyltransferase Ste14